MFSLCDLKDLETETSFAVAIYRNPLCEGAILCAERTTTATLGLPGSPSGEFFSAPLNLQQLPRFACRGPLSERAGEEDDPTGGVSSFDSVHQSPQGRRAEFFGWGFRGGDHDSPLWAWGLGAMESCDANGAGDLKASFGEVLVKRAGGHLARTDPGIDPIAGELGCA